MMKLINLFGMSLLLFATSCYNANANKTKEQENEQFDLPAGAVELKYQQHLYCKVILRDSIPARMIFDTGCTNLLLDSTFYSEKFAKNGNLRKAMLGGAGGGMEMANIDASKWTYHIGEETMTEDIATVLNLRKIVGDDADGMVGMTFMKGKRVEFNYANSYLRFLPTEETIGEDYTRIPCSWLYDNMRIVLPLSITLSDDYVFNGNFLVDTGMPGFLSLNSTTANRLNSEKYLANARSMSYSVGGIGGNRKDHVFKTPLITVGGHVIKDVMITWKQ